MISEYELNDRMAKAASGEASPDERAELLAWVAADPAVAKAWRHTQKLWEQASAIPQEEHDAPVDTDIAWQTVRRRMRREAGPLRAERGGLNLRLWMAAASVIVLLSVAWLWHGRSGAPLPETVAVNAAVPTTLHLNEQSVVQLQAGSQVELDTAAFAQQRRIRLVRGAAFFDVAKRNGQRFTVETEQARVIVLGTEFTVTLKGGATEVAVQEGKVRVLRLRKGVVVDSTLLLPGQAARIAGEALTGQPAAPTAAFWATQTLRLRGMPLGELCTVLTEAYGQPVVVLDGEVAQQRVTGVYRQKPLQDVLASICELHNLKLREGTDTLYLEPKN